MSDELVCCCFVFEVAFSCFSLVDFWCVVSFFLFFSISDHC